MCEQKIISGISDNNEPTVDTNSNTLQNDGIDLNECEFLHFEVGDYAFDGDFDGDTVVRD